MGQTLKQKAKEELLRGIKDGTIKISFTHTCSWCKKIFSSNESFDAHLIKGKTVDPETGKKRMLCPN